MAFNIGIHNTYHVTSLIGTKYVKIKCSKYFRKKESEGGREDFFHVSYSNISHSMASIYDLSKYLFMILFR